MSFERKSSPLVELSAIVKAGSKPGRVIARSEMREAAVRLTRWLCSTVAMEVLSRTVCAFDCDDPDVLLGDGYPQWFGNRPLVQAILSTIAQHALEEVK